MPLSIGEEKAKSAKQLTITKDIPVEYLDTKCQQCKLAKVLKIYKRRLDMVVSIAFYSYILTHLAYNL